MLYQIVLGCFWVIEARHEEAGRARYYIFCITRTNPMQNSYYSTIIDLNMGKPEYFVDTIRNEIIITAGGDVILSLRLCWMSSDLERVHIRHMRELAKLISVPYYERLIALRSQAMFTNTDFSIDIGFIQSKLAENKQENIEFLKKIRKYTILKG